MTAVGGGSRSELWLRIIATVLDIPVDVPAAGDFGGAFGAARLGLIAATGATSTGPSARRPKPPRPFKPEAKARAAYEDAYRALRANLSRDQGDQPLMTNSIRITDPIKYEGPDSRNPWPSAGTIRSRRCWARPWRSICALRCATGTRCAGRASIPLAARPSMRPWHQPGDAMAACAHEGRCDVRNAAAARRRLLHLP